MHTTAKIQNFTKAFAALVFALSILAGSAGQILAGDVDLTAAGCPPFPEPAKQLGLWFVLHSDGTAEDCEIAVGGSRNCSAAYDPREGFLCVSFNGDKHPRTVNTSAEGPESSPVDRFIIDGVVAGPVYGYANSRFVAPLGGGPSGETYDVVAETSVGGTNFSARLNVT